MMPPAPGLRGLARRPPPGPAELRRTAGVEDAIRPLHRRTRTEDTAGPRESALHSLMFTDTGVPA
jgi:hypothetical protein